MSLPGRHLLDDQGISVVSLRIDTALQASLSGGTAADLAQDIVSWSCPFPVTRETPLDVSFSADVALNERVERVLHKQTNKQKI